MLTEHHTLYPPPPPVTTLFSTQIACICPHKQGTIVTPGHVLLAELYITLTLLLTCANEYGLKHLIGSRLLQAIIRWLARACARTSLGTRLALPLSLELGGWGSSDYFTSVVERPDC